MTKPMLERLHVTEIVTDEDYRSHALPCDPLPADITFTVSETTDSAEDKEACQMPAER